MQKPSSSPLSRREFLKLAGLNLGSLLVPARLLFPPPADTWPSLAIDQLPPAIADIIQRMPRARVDSTGYLTLEDADKLKSGRVPLAPTNWNLERRGPRDRLLPDVTWGIVLHWFGDTPDHNLDLQGYLRGFNGKRQVEDYITTTSAHFLVGEGRPATRVEPGAVGIAQVQVPDRDGTPFIASHLRGLSFGPHDQQKQYFVRAYYQLAAQDATIHSLLQEMYDGRWIHPNQRTLAVEITGADFNNNFPAPQQIANVLSVVWALMARYQIRPSSLLGHHEIQMNKGDPGKQFMAMLRYLVGVKALLEPDPALKMLVFGQHLATDSGPHEAVERYFNLARDYHVLVSKPVQVFQWEALSQYWFLYPQIASNARAVPVSRTFVPPIAGDFIKNGYDFLLPDNHEGIDLHHPIPRGAGRPEKNAQVQLIGDGQCLYAGQVKDCHPGKLAIFRHMQPDGAQVLSVYGHLSEMADIQPGSIYPLGQRIGQVNNDSLECGRFLHFAIGFGAAWDLDLRREPSIPEGAGPTWIRERYLEPIEYLKSRKVSLPAAWHTAN